MRMDSRGIDSTFALSSGISVLPISRRTGSRTPAACGSGAWCDVGHDRVSHRSGPPGDRAGESAPRVRARAGRAGDPTDRGRAVSQYGTESGGVPPIPSPYSDASARTRLVRSSGTARPRGPIGEGRDFAHRPLRQLGTDGVRDRLSDPPVRCARRAAEEPTGGRTGQLVPPRGQSFPHTHRYVRTGTSAPSSSGRVRGHRGGSRRWERWALR